MDVYYPFEFETARVDGESGFEFTCGLRMLRCHSMLGTAVVSGGYPLYADAMNEKGVCMAGLEFPEYAYYAEEPKESKLAVSPFEFIPWILAQCASVSEAETLLKRTALVNRSFSESLPLTPLHWMIADRERSIVVEAVHEGLRVYPSDCNVLTNAPDYPFHTVNLRQFANLTADQPTKNHTFGSPFSSGFGAIGLPGDFSSASRFVKAAFIANNASTGIDTANDGVARLLRSLFSVAVPWGAVKTKDGMDNVTIYTSCMDVASGKYYRLPYELSGVISDCSWDFYG